MSPSPDVVEIVARLRRRIDTRLNNVLCEMKSEYDDSITGFNEAWDIVREIFNENEKVESLYAAWKARPHYRRREAADALDRMKAELDALKAALTFELRVSANRAAALAASAKREEALRAIVHEVFTGHESGWIVADTDIVPEDVAVAFFDKVARAALSDGETP